MDWLQITVLTTTEGSEIVSQLLLDAGSQGTMIEDKNDVAANQRPEGQWDIIDETIAERIGDDVKVTGYYAMDARIPDTMAHIKSRLVDIQKMDLGIDFGKMEIVTANLDDEDWAEYWKKQYKPFRLGKHMVVKPGWEEFDPEPEDKIIEIDPGMAFGTGTHETTGMCVKLVEETVKPGDTVIDVGTGTGILAIAAAHMGAGKLLAIDLDPMAVRVARENVKINGFADKIRCEEGDLLKAVDEQANVVIANIIADVIIYMAEPVRKHILPGGVFICSGIARERKQEVIDALNAAQYKNLLVLDEGEWTAIRADKD